MGGSVLIGGKYDLVRQLGTGVLGSVWEAEEPARGQRVALKLMSCPTDELCERILDEARLAQGVAFPSLVKILDVGEAREREPFVAMELLSGETLAERLARETKLSPKLAAQIGRDVAAALTTAHAARLEHGDLRPANVFLVGEPGCAEPIVKLFDLWMARSLGPETAEAMGLDSPSYKSPEQIASRQTPDVRSDLWSLGVLLFEMIAGKSPFGDSRKPAEIAEAAMHAPIPKLSSLAPDIDLALEEIVTRCLERERDKRIGSAMVVTHMLNAIAEPGVKKAAPARGSSSTSRNAVMLSSATEVYTVPTSPRGQLGTLVMSSDGPLPAVQTSNPNPAPGPVSGPLGTMVMGSGMPLPATRAETSGQFAAPSPREPLTTEVFPELATEVYQKPLGAPATSPPPPMRPAVEAPSPPRLATMTNPRMPQATSTMPPYAATSSQRVLMIALAAGVVLLVGLVVLFVLL